MASCWSPTISVEIADGLASAPPELAGLLEVRGLGLVRLPCTAAARLALAVDLAAAPERLPRPARHAETGLPLVALDPKSPLGPRPRRTRARLRPRPGRRSPPEPSPHERRMTAEPAPVAYASSWSPASRAPARRPILHALEDLGYEAVDNPPLPLLDELVGRSDRPLAIGIDARTRGFDAAAVLATLAAARAGTRPAPELVFA